MISIENEVMKRKCDDDISSSAKAQVKIKKSKNRGVLFSQDLVYIEPSLQPNSLEQDKMWYSGEEILHHKNILIQDVRAAERLLSTQVAQGLPKDQLLPNILGIETFLSPEIARRALLDKQRHVNMIIAQQWNLQEQDLCSLSVNSSWLTCERSRLSAASYWDMSDDRVSNNST